MKKQTHYPRRKIYWGRGNGWVICSLPMILENLPLECENRTQIIQILQDTSRSLLRYQRDDGYFETVLNTPGRTYRESSATALIAAGWMHGVRCGWLDERFAQPAVKAFEAVVDHFAYVNGAVFMTEISGPTIPLPLLPYLGYQVIPRKNNYPYGIAAVIFAAIEYERRKQK